MRMEQSEQVFPFLGVLPRRDDFNNINVTEPKSRSKSFLDTSLFSI